MTGNTITNRDLDEKLDKIHSRINNLVGVANDNRVSIVKLVEHVKNQNGRVGKLESNYEGADGTLRMHESELNEVCAQVKTHLEAATNWSNRKWAIILLAFGGGMSMVTAIIVEVVRIALHGI